MYSIVFSDRAEKDFASLEFDVRDRILSVLERISISPRRFLKKLSGSSDFRLRVGIYRLIIYLDEKSQTIMVSSIGKRDSVYL
ncbi:MAG: type II toxin-antitoxin system RelE/ParE family toxin [Candidatus Micrarchaeia archaeon]|jgi:mRNA interferase RelE/StbE